MQLDELARDFDARAPAAAEPQDQVGALVTLDCAVTESAVAPETIELEEHRAGLEQGALGAVPRQAVERVRVHDPGARHETRPCHEILAPAGNLVAEAKGAAGAVERELPDGRAADRSRALARPRAAELRLHEVEAAEHDARVRGEHAVVVRRAGETAVGEREPDDRAGAEVAPQPRDVEQ